MRKRGPFDLPISKEQSTRGARSAYQQVWQYEWPHDDDCLRLLAREAKDKAKPGTKCATLLNAMRECHAFETVH